MYVLAPLILDDAFRKSIEDSNEAAELLKTPDYVKYLISIISWKSSQAMSRQLPNGTPSPVNPIAFILEGFSQIQGFPLNVFAGTDSQSLFMYKSN